MQVSKVVEKTLKPPEIVKCQFRLDLRRTGHYRGLLQERYPPRAHRNLDLVLRGQPARSESDRSMSLYVQKPVDRHPVLQANGRSSRS